MDWWATTLLDTFFPLLEPEARHVLSSCLLPPSDQQASAILLISTAPPTRARRRRGRQGQDESSSIPDRELALLDDDASSAFEEDAGLDSLSGNDILSGDDGSEDNSPIRATGVGACPPPRANLAALIPHHLLVAYRWDVGLSGPSVGECALVSIHDSLLTRYMRFDGSNMDDSHAVRVAMGLLSSTLASIFAVPSPYYDDARDVASLHLRRVPRWVLQGNGGAAC